MSLDKTNILKAKMLEALEESLGVVTSATKAVGLNRSTHYDWYNNDPEYKAAVDAISDVALDFAENALHNRIKSGSDTATIFYLKCKGKQRGYIDNAGPQVNINAAEGAIINWSEDDKTGDTSVSKTD